MATVDKILQGVRIRLGSPSRATLTDRTLLALLYDWHQHYFGMLKTRSQEGWMLGRFPLTVSAGTDEYPMGASAPNFAGALLVTTDPELSTDGCATEIPMVRVQDADLRGAAYTRTSGGTDTVEAIAFFSTVDGWRAKTYPRGAAGNLLVWYEVAQTGETALENAPLLPANFHNLLTVAVALDAVDECSWDGKSEEYSERMREGKRRTLERAKMEMEREFRISILEANADDTGARDVFESTPGVWANYRNGWGG